MWNSLKLKINVLPSAWPHSTGLEDKAQDCSVVCTGPSFTVVSECHQSQQMEHIMITHGHIAQRAPDSLGSMIVSREGMAGPEGTATLPPGGTEMVQTGR